MRAQQCNTLLATKTTPEGSNLPPLVDSSHLFDTEHESERALNEDESGPVGEESREEWCGGGGPVKSCRQLDFGVCAGSGWMRTECLVLCHSSTSHVNLDESGMY